MLVCILPMTLGAQTIHWLTFIDTTDLNVGKLDINGREVLYNHFVNVVNAAVTEKGYRTNIQDIYGSTLSPQKCRDIVNSLKVDPDDIVVFYYIGHGTHGTVGGSPWPMMFMGHDNPNDLVRLKEDVYDVLLSKGARLTATIGMCCNVYQDIPRTDTPSFGVNYGNTYLTETEKNAIQKMFLEHKGDFLLSSASPGQSSVGGNTPLGPMDLFTCVLVKNFEDSASEGDLEWNTLFNDVAAVVNEVTKGQQTPIFVANITKSEPIDLPKPQPPTPVVVVPQANNSELLNKVGVALDNLIDLRHDEAYRMLQADELEKVFSSKAIVKVISQDGNVIVDKSTAIAFVRRLATSRILLKVSPISVKVTDNKIVELRVREIYKKWL